MRRAKSGAKKPERRSEEARKLAAPADAPVRSCKRFRNRIDGIDEQIHALLNERARCAQQVGVAKQAQGLHTADFYRPEREAQVLRKAIERNKGPLRNEEIVRLFREIMSACLAQEEPLEDRLPRARRHVLAASRAEALRTFGARVAVAGDQRSVRRSAGGSRGLRRRADRELDRRHGQQHARHVPELTAQDLRRSRVAHPSASDGSHEGPGEDRARVLASAVAGAMSAMAR